MPQLPDGRYDVLVVDAEEIDTSTLHLELVIVAGASKGEVVGVRAAHLARDPIDLMGLPATLLVEAGSPRVVIDDE
ncbi:MAG TPA: hypothetical protein VHN98_11080 [Acidimicrobiales bacterium]|nr:hypothetical protein [Acidimicrobiales bacterium]